MASKQKRHGRRAIKTLKEAIKKCDSSPEIFFHRATLASNVPGPFNAREEAAKFIRTIRNSPMANQEYWVPEHVLTFAKLMLEHASPYSFFRSLRVRYCDSAPFAA